MSVYEGHPLTQFDGGPLANQNCAPTSVAMAADQASGGATRWTGSEVRALIPRSEETNPKTPGWSMHDVDRAFSKLGVDFTDASGQTWRDLIARRAEGRAIVLSGDSDQFLAGCGSVFDGDHCICVPAQPPDPGAWRLGDPVCRPSRWTEQDPVRVRAYAEKYGRGRYGVTVPQRIVFGYTDPVPQEPDMTTVTITTLPFGGVYVIPAGKAVTGFKLTGDGKVGEKKEWAARPAPSSAAFDAYMTSTAITGNPFIRVTTGSFAGYYITAGAVDETVNAAPPAAPMQTVTITGPAPLKVTGP